MQMARAPGAFFGFSSRREWQLAVWRRSPRVRLIDNDDKDEEPPALAPPAPRQRHNHKPAAPHAANALHAVAASQMQRKAPAVSRAAAPLARSARAPTPPPPLEDLVPEVVWPAAPPAGADPVALFAEPEVVWPELPGAPAEQAESNDAGGDGMLFDDAQPELAAAPPDAQVEQADGNDVPAEQDAGGDGMLFDDALPEPAAGAQPELAAAPLDVPAGQAASNDAPAEPAAAPPDAQRANGNALLGLLEAARELGDAAPARKPRAKRDVTDAEIPLLPPPKRQSALRAEKQLLDAHQREEAARAFRAAERAERESRRKQRKAKKLERKERKLSQPAAQPAPAPAAQSAPATSPSPLAAISLPVFTLPPFLPSMPPMPTLPLPPAVTLLPPFVSPLPTLPDKPFATRVAETMVNEGRRAGTSLSHPLPRRMQRRAEYVPFTEGLGPVPRGTKMWTYFVAACMRCHQPPASYADALQRMRILGTHIAVCRPCMDAVTRTKNAPLLLPKYPARELPPLVYDANAHAELAAERARAGLAEQAPRSALEDVECLVPYERNIGAVTPMSPLWGYYSAECTRCFNRPDGVARYRLLGTPLVVCLSCYADVGDKWLRENDIEPHA